MNDIHKATERRKFQLVFEILQKDPSQVHARTTGLVPNNQPLHLAAWQGRKKLAKLILNAGADINARGDSGRTPLCYAVENDSAALIKLLSVDCSASKSLLSSIPVPSIEYKTLSSLPDR